MQKMTDRKINTNTTSNDNKNELCWYHENYGNKAYRCHSPCNFHNLIKTESPSSAPRIGDIQTTFTVQPSNCSHKFLVDTGSIVSLLPFNTVNSDTDNSSNTTLFAANGSQIKTAGKQNIELNINGKIYNWTFIIANVTNPILGADFLTHYNLLVDCKNKKYII